MSFARLLTNLFGDRCKTGGIVPGTSDPRVDSCLGCASLERNLKTAGETAICRVCGCYWMRSPEPGTNTQ